LSWVHEFIITNKHLGQAKQDILIRRNYDFEFRHETDTQVYYIFKRHKCIQIKITNTHRSCEKRRITDLAIHIYIYTYLYDKLVGLTSFLF